MLVRCLKMAEKTDITVARLKGPKDAWALFGLTAANPDYAINTAYSYPEMLEYLSRKDTVVVGLKQDGKLLGVAGGLPSNNVAELYDDQISQEAKAAIARHADEKTFYLNDLIVLPAVRTANKGVAVARYVMRDLDQEVSQAGFNRYFSGAYMPELTGAQPETLGFKVVEEVDPFWDYNTFGKRTREPATLTARDVGSPLAPQRSRK
jgi:hypothetical protein